ncbi:MAG: NAD(P)H-binding protein [Candidatus Acidiferrum sp.]
MYVILGATGNTGSAIAETLLAKGEKVRAVGRSTERLAKVAGLGAEPFVGDIADSEFLTRAFDGARAVYFMLPPDPTSNDYRGHQRQIIEAGATALEAAHVHYVVALSSFGADKESGTGPVAGLHEMESRLQRIAGLNALYLRAGYFMENVLPQVGVIQKFGMIATPLRSDLLLPLIATEDIAAAAAEHLLKLDFSGHQTRELQGQRDISFAEVARIVGAAIGKPSLGYMQFPNEQFIEALTQMGFSGSFAGLMVEMTDALNDGRMRTLEPRSAGNTTPTSFETFVQNVFVPAFRGKAATA